MGVIKRGILGGFSGKVANIIGGSWKGIAYMRSMPLSVANPNTPAQQEQRGAFRECLKVGQLLLGSFIRPFWNRLASGMSGFNYFQSRNIAAFNETGLVNHSAFYATVGSLTGIANPFVSWNSLTSELTIGWDNNTGDGTAAATDEFIAAIYNESADEWYSFVTADPRSSQQAVLSMPGSTTGDDCHLYLGFKTANDVTSTSVYLTATL